MSERKHKLVIVESPAKARTIAKYLGRSYKVEASNGHVRDLPKSQMGVDVAADFEPKYITIRGRGEVLARIRKEAKNASAILLATDPDREGEAISWHLANLLGVKPETACRVTFQEITSKAVKTAIQHPRPIDMSLVNAQQARRVLDRLVGYSISPLLWAKIKKGLSGGRVQSVATRIIVDREEEIESFIPEEYWDVEADMISGGQTFHVKLDTLDGKKAKLTGEAGAKAALEAIGSGPYTVKTVKNGEKRKTPAPPFTTSNMQQEAARKLRFTTAKTMQIAQTLYEGVDLEGEGAQGLISYIRTDSTRVSDEALAAVREEIGKRFGSEYLPGKPNEFKTRSRSQDAHEAIRPTDISRRPDDIKSSLTNDQYKLYKLAYTRFLSSQMAPALYDTQTACVANERAEFRFYGEHKKFPGFTAVYEEGVDDETPGVDVKLPRLAAGDAAVLGNVTSEQRFTQPPPRYTEASLVRALEEKGIGRPSTYAPTISTIVARGYVSRDKSRLTPTELGRMITALMREHFKDIVDVEFTSGMEDSLDRVEDESLPWRDVIREFYSGFSRSLEAAESAIEKVEVKDETSDVPCEKCGAMMVYKMGRYGRFLACPRFPECRCAKPVYVYIATPCPKCGARLLEKTSRKGNRFYSCETYPDCDFIAWDFPLPDKCPKCGSYMTLKTNRKGSRWRLCANEHCRYREEIADEEQADDQETDGQGLYGSAPGYADGEDNPVDAERDADSYADMDSGEEPGSGSESE
ncbi:MAG: type I DNA topoisomerase [Oscillospiraceae bacterium]|nr:type I DNA topoisomerase [Oscillospiraceae bacterium]